jgi:membrane associated rhomboid family serine protease
MPTSVFALLVLSGAALYFMTVEERTRLLRSALHVMRTSVRTAAHSASSGEPFDEFLRARTGWPVVTLLLVAANVVTFVCMIFGRGALGDPQTLIDWGGSVAPRTANGEWWRLITSLFVHAGALHLLATIAGLVPLGVILERAVGRVAFATTYLAAGVLAGIVNLWTTSPTTVTTGASGAIFGLYGLLLASIPYAVFSPPEVPIPFVLLKRIAAAAGPFLLYNLVTDHVGTAAELAGLGVGFVGGLFVARGVTREKPPVRRAALVMTAALAIAAGAGVPLRGIVDVRPEIARVAAVEERTAGVYEAALAKFRRGRISMRELAQTIDRTIVPDLQAVHTRLKEVRGVPLEQTPLVTAAEEYLALREQSWRYRADGLRNSKMDMLRKADLAERSALDSFEKIRPSM